jgi:threonine/homoserine/homoserine lactone efflux protein
MWELFTIGFMAGLALAIPVGPMAIMLINTTISRGLRHGVVGALGMATVDGAYALAVFVIGGIIAAALTSLKLVFGLIGAGILLVLGIQTAYKNLKLLRTKDSLVSNAANSGSVGKTFGTFVAATVVNAPTALYFLAIAPNVANMGYSLTATNVAIFVISVFVGSLIWQEALVFTGLAIRGITTNRFRAWIGLVGGGLIIGLAISIGVRAFWS